MIPKLPGPRHSKKIVGLQRKRKKSFGHLTNTTYDLKGYAGGW